MATANNNNKAQAMALALCALFEFNGFTMARGSLPSFHAAEAMSNIRDKKKPSFSIQFLSISFVIHAICMNNWSTYVRSEKW